MIEADNSGEAQVLQLRLQDYLSPEPLLQSPEYVSTMAQSGMSVPTYAYAANNPLRYVDADGLRISTTINVSYNQTAGAPGPFGPRPGTTLQTLTASWSQGCKKVNGKWKFDASVDAQVTVDLNRDSSRRSLNDGNACSISDHEEGHVGDVVDGISEIEKHFPSEGFRSKAACDEAFRAFANEANINAYGNYVMEGTRSFRDPFDFAR